MDALSMTNAMSMATPNFLTNNAATAPRLASQMHLPAGPSLDKTAQDFESVFMSQMLQPMFSSVDVDEVFGGGHGEEVMRGMLVQEYGKAMAANKSTPLSFAIRNEMIKKQSQNKASSRNKSLDIVS